MSDSSHGADNEGRDGKTRGDSIQTTIVGARPGRDSRRDDIPRGIEVLIKKAAVDPEFRSLLLDKRSEAASEIDLELTPVEAATLDCIPPAQIEKIIEKTTIPDEHRRVFLGKIAAAMLAVLSLPVTAGVEAWQFSMTGHSAADDRFKYRNSRKSLPLDGTGMATLEKSAVPVNAENERLQVTIRDGGRGSTTVSVHYDCPFEQGEITVVCRNRRELTLPITTCKPPRHFVWKGKGKVSFQVSGSSGTTQFVVAGICSSEKYCRRALDRFTRWPLDAYEPGEYIVDDCVICRITEHRKQWHAFNEP